MDIEAFPLASLVGNPAKGDFPTSEERDCAAETHRGNEGGRLEQLQQFAPADSNASVFGLSEDSLELVTNADREEAILYIYRNGNFARTMVGSFTTLREYARREYADAPIHELYPSTTGVR